MSRLRGALLGTLLLAAAPALAERLPWNVYTTADGLAGDTVRALKLDSRGFLWIGTSSGLSRFDGRQFRNWDTADGLPSPRIESIAETPDGSIWVATGEGLARLRPDLGVGGPAFTVEPLAEPWGRAAVDLLFVDRAGTLWAALSRQLVRLEMDASGALRPPSVAWTDDAGEIRGLAEGADGSLWIAAGREVLRLGPEGARERWRIGAELGGKAVAVEEIAQTVAADREGRLWVGGSGLLVVWMPPPSGGGTGLPLLVGARVARFAGDLPAAVGERVVYGEEQGFPGPFVNAIAVGRDETWVTTRHGAFALSPRGSRTIGAGQGLVEDYQGPAVEDVDGGLWLGSESRGLSRLGRSGFVAFDATDGLVGDRATSIFDGPGGQLHVVTGSRELHRFDGQRFVPVTPRELFRGARPGWGWNQYVTFDRRGALWYPTADGLFRFAPRAPGAALAEARPERHWSAGAGLPGDDVFRIYEDRRGDVWVSTISAPCLTRIEGGETSRPVPELHGREAVDGAPTAFAEDAAGNLWMGFYLGRLARVSNGAWRFFAADDGVPPGPVHDLHLDRAGRLWVATGAGGVARVDDPAAENPQFVRYTSRDGLSTDSARCLTEDAVGRIFVGTTRGVDRLDPASGGVRSFSREDGLPNTLVSACHAAGDGALWFGTLHGLARFLPPAESPPSPPRVWLSRIVVGGEVHPLPERGVESVSGLRLGPGQRSLGIEFVGAGLALGRNLRFQHRVFGATEEWSAPSAEGSVQFAALSPGSYRFEVRATTREGLAAGHVAAVDFRVLPPIWRRGWFLALVALALAGGLIALARLRTARLVAVEQARTRIASDLHDDVGSGVSRIGLLGELARRRVRDTPEAAEEILNEIGQEAAELAEATSDIVWAVDPRRDDLGSLVVRLRRFAADLLEAKEIGLRFVPPADAAKVPLTPEVRRALYLTLKEAIHNVAKHSEARRAEVRIESGDGEVRAEVVDDGHGIAAGRAEEAAAEGRHGLTGMRARAAEAGGEARIEPVAGGGTRVLLRFPFRAAAGSHRRAIPGRRRG